MKQLTQQQKRFVSEYIKTLDGELAAKKSGYKCKDLKTFASTLLMKDYIIHEIKAQLKLQDGSKQHCRLILLFLKILIIFTA